MENESEQFVDVKIIKRYDIFYTTFLKCYKKVQKDKKVMNIISDNNLKQNLSLEKNFDFIF